MTKLRIMCELRQLDHIHGAGEVGLSSVRYMQPIALTSIMHCTFFVLCGHLAKFSWSKPEACSRAVKMLFHSIGHSVRLGPDPRDGHPTLQKLRKKHRILSHARASVSQRQNESNLPRDIRIINQSKGLPRITVHSFSVSCYDHWKGKFVWFHNNIHLTNSSKLHWTERHHEKIG